MKVKRKWLILIALMVLFTGGCSLKTNTENLKDQSPSPQEITKEVGEIRITTGGQKGKEGTVPVASLAISNGSAEIPRGVWGYPVLTEKMFSPNGEWVAFTGSRNDNGRGLWAVTMNGSQGNLLATIEEKEHTSGTLMINLLGWTDKNEVVFTRQGTQPDGPHQGERGISLRIISPEGKNAQELSWIPVPKGMVDEVEYFPEQGFIITRTTGSIWRVDLTNGQKKLLRKDLPNYDGLFRARLSPGGNYYVYELRKDNKWCIYCLNTLTGEENLVVSEGKTFNFYPQWSPDGQYLAYYAAAQNKEGPIKQDIYRSIAQEYDIIPGEDGPEPIAATVSIVIPKGKKITHLAVSGAKIMDFCWSQDSKHLAFAAGQTKVVDKGETGTGPIFKQVESIWVADLEGETKKLADLSAQASNDIKIINVFSDGRQVYYFTFDSQGNSSLWLARESKQPMLIDPDIPGGWWEYSVFPSLGDELFLCRYTDKKKEEEITREEEIYRIHGTKAVQLTFDGGEKPVFGLAGNWLVYTQQSKPEENSSKIVILQLPKAKEPLYDH